MNIVRIAPRRVLSCITLLAPLLAGCSSVGDFGRWNEWGAVETRAEVVNAEPVTTGSISSFPFTDEERQLRKLADNLLEPPLEHNRWFAYGPGRSRVAVPAPTAFDRETYAAKLLNGHYRSPTSRYARLIDDIRNDMQRLDPFFGTARRVADLDRKREKALGLIMGPTPGEVSNTQARVRDNMSVILVVHRTLMQRVDAYRYALERMVIAMPSPMAAEAERIWAEFERRVSEIQVLIAGPAVGPVVMGPVGRGGPVHVSK